MCIYTRTYKLPYMHIYISTYKPVRSLVYVRVIHPIHAHITTGEDLPRGRGRTRPSSMSYPNLHILQSSVHKTPG